MKTSLLCLSLCISLGAACTDRGAEPSAPAPVKFTPFETDNFQTTEVIDIKPQLPPKKQAELDELIKTFAPRASAFLKSPEALKRIDPIEQAYLKTGRVFELIEIYNEDIKAQGIAKSLAAPRLAWVHIRLAQDKESKALLKGLLKAQPNNPDAWFLYGAYWIKYAKEDREAAKRLILGWSKAVEIDENYKGFEKITAPILRREVRNVMMRTPIPPDEIDVLEVQLIGRPKPPEPTPEGTEESPEKPLKEAEDATKK